MAYKFTCMTVQHTGTRFLENYFLSLGFSPLNFVQRCRVCDEVYDYTHEHVDEKNKSGEIEYNWMHYTATSRIKFCDVERARRGYPIVSTLRHPYKIAISFHVRGYDLSRCLGMLDNFIETSIKRHIVYYDLDCPKDKVRSNMIRLLKEIDCYTSTSEKLTDDFLSNYKPRGVYTSDMKDAYLRDGTLPDIVNWRKFDRAVNWYNKKIEEVRSGF